MFFIENKTIQVEPQFFHLISDNVISVDYLSYQVLVEGFWEATNYVQKLFTSEDSANDEPNANHCLLNFRH